MTLPLPLNAVEELRPAVSANTPVCPSAIEEDDFPFEDFSDVAELESWRKEINRPIYHIHKWWAQRLGSVFRAIIIGTLTPAGSNVKRSFYRPVRFPDVVVFDPFMGSGTTLGEALKLGCRAVGRDINPVAHFAVRNALALHSRETVVREFKSIESDVTPEIRYFYEARLPNGEYAQSLYYFWVKVLDCPGCGGSVDLFRSYIFARHAYPKRHPQARVLCPSCGAVDEVRYDTTTVTCGACACAFDPRDGPANGTKATCPGCRHAFSIAKTARDMGRPPGHRLYAKLVLTSSGEKRYLPVDDLDRERYGEASAALQADDGFGPEGILQPGYNTNQALNYGYRSWRDMFNDRQLLCLGKIAERIHSIDNEITRDLFTCLFSGTLEFNNMFASYKGEGTGAVRHMFAHHILKPERTPLEANPWGTPRSSGAFSTLFERRLLRAMAYREDPFELMVGEKNGRLAGKKVFGLSESIGYPIAGSFDAFDAGQRVYLSCGDSSRTDLATDSVDVVVTDPPFFDNVHYSQLADFFHVWQRRILGNSRCPSETTHSDREVQRTNAVDFVNRLQDVWKECSRVLKPGGLLVFTYHHSRPEGWYSIHDALAGADFAIVAAHPIKGEMSVAMPKGQAREPIDLDIILVCRKRKEVRTSVHTNEDAWSCAIQMAGQQIDRLNRAGRKLSRNDIRVVVMAQVVRFLSCCTGLQAARTFIESRNAEVEDTIESFMVSATGVY